NLPGSAEIFRVSSVSPDSLVSSHTHLHEPLEGGGLHLSAHDHHHLIGQLDLGLSAKVTARGALEHEAEVCTRTSTHTRTHTHTHAHAHTHTHTNIHTRRIHTYRCYNTCVCVYLSHFACMCVCLCPVLSVRPTMEEQTD